MYLKEGPGFEPAAHWGLSVCNLHVHPGPEWVSCGATVSSHSPKTYKISAGYLIWWDWYKLSMGVNGCLSVKLVTCPRCTLASHPI